MHQGLTTVLAAGVFVGLACRVDAAGPQTVITFGNTSRDLSGAGPIQESGFEYEAVGSWSLQNGASIFPSFPSHSLLTFWNTRPIVAQSVTFFRPDDVPFSFVSL